MTASSDTLDINVTVNIKAATLQAIVQNAKNLAGRDENGRYRVDTAETVNRLVSAFLKERGFDDYISDLSHYRMI